MNYELQALELEVCRRWWYRRWLMWDTCQRDYGRVRCLTWNDLGRLVVTPACLVACPL